MGRRIEQHYAHAHGWTWDGVTSSRTNQNNTFFPLVKIGSKESEGPTQNKKESQIDAAATLDDKTKFLLLSIPPFRFRLLVFFSCVDTSRYSPFLSSSPFLGGFSSVLLYVEVLFSFHFHSGVVVECLSSSPPFSRSPHSLFMLWLVSLKEIYISVYSIIHNSKSCVVRS